MKVWPLGPARLCLHTSLSAPAGFLLSTLLMWPVALTTDRHRWKGFLGDGTEKGLAWGSDLIDLFKSHVSAGNNGKTEGPSSSSSPPAGWGEVLISPLLFFSSSHPLFVLLFHLFLVPLHLFDVPAVKTGSYQ